jgi:hypothetical protein
VDIVHQVRTTHVLVKTFSRYFFVGDRSYCGLIAYCLSLEWCKLFWIFWD